MLRVSKLTDYGTLVLTHMAGFPDHLFSVAELTQILHLNAPTISKVLKALGRHELVSSVRGARGGYALARPATQISVAQIIDALEDQPFGLTECSATAGTCDIEGDCRIRANWQRINTVVRRVLDDVCLADMVEPLPPATEARMVRHATPAIKCTPQ
ncbi:MAG TPA: SUF system Fe-S cluster assembly regulator [Denitromonas sp.]|uniref:SUF system Fe-S cluster assembly regulator n=1 Tax=Denitromonas sp. TaxID=2734609 RepID=UPI001D4A7411|nr:SUF system Fe-S cluster assembly regulator [Rhodocyclaceae bacterium]MCP5221416.1 SUF system Fe-S cluster assembly regulator [Zoogloeaceae bacterium]HPR05861.1 SUF system Fe-S cluster assembly regulator [Denitromonas sp.]HQU90319.1 SUF system Fe-S cluster assembly regulator [Denitromonas sp.]HQV16448.1 SUF system Fe-S cluster assembly regulator [Denitromonas sp.]